jgi:hypothetical protein
LEIGIFGKEGTAKGILFQRKRRKNMREKIKRIHNFSSFTQEIDSVPKRKALSVGSPLSIPPRSWRDSIAMSQPRWKSPTKRRTEAKTLSKKENKTDKGEKKTKSFPPKQISKRERKTIKPKRRFKTNL